MNFLHRAGTGRRPGENVVIRRVNNRRWRSSSLVTSTAQSSPSKKLRTMPRYRARDRFSDIQQKESPGHE